MLFSERIIIRFGLNRSSVLWPKFLKHNSDDGTQLTLQLLAWAKKISTALEEIEIPKSFSQASKSSDWKEAMDCEMKSMHEYDVWELVTPPSDANIVTCKWVYTIKYTRFILT